MTCHRFRPSRPVATLLATGRQRTKRRQVGALQNKHSDHDHQLILVVDDPEKGRAVSAAWTREQNLAVTISNPVG